MDLDNLSAGPWEYSFEGGAHYVVSAYNGKIIAVFSDEKDARGLVELLADLPQLLDEYGEKVLKEEYEELQKEHKELESDLEDKEADLGELTTRVELYEDCFEEITKLVEISRLNVIKGLNPL